MGMWRWDKISIITNQHYRDDDCDGGDEPGGGHYHHLVHHVNIDHFSNHHQHRDYETAAAAEGLW